MTDIAHEWYCTLQIDLVFMDYYSKTDLVFVMRTKIDSIFIASWTCTKINSVFVTCIRIESIFIACIKIDSVFCKVRKNSNRFFYQRKIRIELGCTQIELYGLE